MFARNKIGPMVRSVWGSTFVDWAVSDAEYPWRISMYASMSRLDWILISTCWEEHFSRIPQSCLPQTILDHFPILFDGGKTHFKLEKKWL